MRSEVNQSEKNLHEIQEQATEEMMQTSGLAQKQNSYQNINHSYHNINKLKRNSRRNSIRNIRSNSNIQLKFHMNLEKFQPQQSIKQKANNQIFSASENSNQVFVNNKYDVSKLLLTDHSVIPTSKVNVSEKEFDVAN